MGAKAGRKGAKGYNVRTYGDSTWRKYLDKTRRKVAKWFAIEDQDIDYYWYEERMPDADRCCCDYHSTNASHEVWGEGIPGNSDPSTPAVARCCSEHRRTDE